jgi:hypothetical protein
VKPVSLQVHSLVAPVGPKLAIEEVPDDPVNQRHTVEELPMKTNKALNNTSYANSRGAAFASITVALALNLSVGYALGSYQTEGQRYVANLQQASMRTAAYPIHAMAHRHSWWA